MGWPTLRVATACGCKMCAPVGKIWRRHLRCPEPCVLCRSRRAFLLRKVCHSSWSCAWTGPPGARSIAFCMHALHDPPPRAPLSPSVCAVAPRARRTTHVRLAHRLDDPHGLLHLPVICRRPTVGAVPVAVVAPRRRAAVVVVVPRRRRAAVVVPEERREEARSVGGSEPGVEGSGRRRDRRRAARGG